MSRFADIIDLYQTIRAEAPIQWRHAELRRQAAIASGCWLLIVLLCGLPLVGGRAAIDVSTSAARAGSHVLDAAGIVHLLTHEPLSLVLPGRTSVLADISGITTISAIMVLGCLAWAVVNKPDGRTFTAIVVGAFFAAFVANLASLAQLMLIAGVTGLPIADGMGSMLAVILRFAVTAGLLICYLATADVLIARWKSWRAIRLSVELRELPPPVVSRYRRFRTAATAWLVCLLTMWLAGRAVTTETLITRYRDTAHRSLGTDEADTATLAVKRLLQLDPLAATHRFLQAQLCEQAGDMQQAESIVREIVDARGGQFEPAQRWMARQIAQQQNHAATKQPIGTGERVSQLEAATRFDPANINAHLSLAESYVARRSPDQAIRELERVVDQRPDLRLTLARLAILAGQTETARLHGKLARTFYREHMRSDPHSVEYRMRLAASQIFLEEFSDAVSVLLEGWELTEDEAFHHGLGVAYLTWHHAASRDGADKREQLSLLEKSLKYAPDSSETLRRLAMLATEEVQSGPAIDLLTRSLAERPIPPTVHLILGTNAFRKGRDTNALRHLEEAYRLDPENVETLNNLAWVLAATDPAALDRSLKLADDAVCREPNRASLRETRGQILAKLGRWTQAIADLENAMQVMQDNAAIHTTLSQAYGELGDAVLADEHRLRAEQLRR